MQQNLLGTVGTERLEWNTEDECLCVSGKGQTRQQERKLVKDASLGCTARRSSAPTPTILPLAGTPPPPPEKVFFCISRPTASLHSHLSGHACRYAQIMGPSVEQQQQTEGSPRAETNRG
ncbi:unnamed protein product [Boreogadus saida]